MSKEHTLHTVTTLDQLNQVYDYVMENLPLGEL